MTEKEFFFKAVLALAGTGKYYNEDGSKFYPRKLVRDTVNLLDAVDQAKNEDIDGYAGQIFEDASWIDRVDLLEANLHAIMNKFNIKIPE